MPSLTRSVQLTKKGVKITGIVIGGLILLSFAINIAISVAKSVFKPKAPPPTVAFGKLTPMNFPNNVTEDQYTYTINTASGTLPTFSDQTTIYQIFEPPPNLLAFQTVSSIVANTEFATALAKSDSETTFEWNIPTLPFKRLVFDSLTNNYDVLSQYYADPAVLSATNLPTIPDAITQAHEFFDTMQSFPKDIDPSKTTTQLFNVKAGQTYAASSLSTAQIIRIDFYQQDYNKLPIFYPNPPYSGISAIIASGKDQSTQIVEAHRNWQQITDTSATYPLKTATQAFDDLQKGKAYIAAYNGSSKTIQINNVLLGYYVGPTQQKYLMPIIVFQGQDGFYAYVSAVTDEMLGK